MSTITSTQLTGIAQVCRGFIVLYIDQYFISQSSGWKNKGLHTCFAAIGSLAMPQPWRKQLANSKMARTSSPFAAPPFFRPAWIASCSTDAAFEAAAVR